MNKIMLGICIIMVVGSMLEKNVEAIAGWFAALFFLYQLTEKS
jgi:hypothetical protein